jgi:hypothetical protein
MSPRPSESRCRGLRRQLVVAHWAFASLQSCPPVGQTARGELIYSLDCKAITTDYMVGENKPNMPQTGLKDTVIPKSGGEQTDDSAPTKGETK